MLDRRPACVTGSPARPGAVASRAVPGLVSPRRSPAAPCRAGSARETAPAACDPPVSGRPRPRRTRSNTLKKQRTSVQRATANGSASCAPRVRREPAGTRSVRELHMRCCRIHPTPPDQARRRRSRCDETRTPGAPCSPRRHSAGRVASAWIVTIARKAGRETRVDLLRQGCQPQSETRVTAYPLPRRQLSHRPMVFLFARR